jgi:hypothetical protein
MFKNPIPPIVAFFSVSPPFNLFIPENSTLIFSTAKKCQTIAAASAIRIKYDLIVDLV